jgi:hypothetical protein
MDAELALLMYSCAAIFVSGCTLYPMATADGMTKSLSRSVLMWRRAVAASYAVHYDLCVIHLVISALVTRVDSGHLRISIDWTTGILGRRVLSE